MTINKCIINLPEKKEFLINPIIDYYTITEKVNFKIVYSDFFRKKFVVQQRFGTYPIYFPEVGYLAALETISPKLSREFYKETEEFDRFYSDEKVICTKIYNFNNKVNRFVSRGKYISSKLPKNDYRLYISNILNDFLFMPSIVKKFGLISPNRWFILESKTSYYFKTEVNYNVGLVYLTKDILKKSKKIILWLNSPLELWEIPAGFVVFTKCGNIIYKNKILIHFLEDPIEEIELNSNKGEYYICFLLSLNDYKTNFPRFRPNIKKKININIVENLTELVYTPYEIIPFIFPNLMESIQLDKLIFEFEVKKDVIEEIIKRLMKFSSTQYPNLIESYEKFFENQNKLFRVKNYEKKLKIELVNPVVIPFLLKENILKRKSGRKEILKNLVHNTMRAIEELKSIQNQPACGPEWYPLRGIDSVIELRQKIFMQYLKIWKRNISI